MPKTSPEYAENRRNEIINACKKLYETMDFKDITIEEISTATSFSRPSIYNYFETKEEIFLAIFQIESELWTDELNTIKREPALPAASLAAKIAHSLEKRGLLLKLLAMNLYDMEENSSLECLVRFKRAYKAAFDAVENLLKHFYPSSLSWAIHLLPKARHPYRHLPWRSHKETATRHYPLRSHCPCEFPSQIRMF